MKFSFMISNLLQQHVVTLSMLYVQQVVTLSVRLSHC